MRHTLTTLTLAAALALPAAAADAKNNKHGNKNARHGHSVSQHCPPGLAKKNPPCVPPGQARKQRGSADHVHDWRGRRVDDGFILITDPSRYGLNPGYAYYRRDGNVFRVDRDTREILNLIGAISAVLN